jgi:hypothetical protein
MILTGQRLLGYRSRRPWPDPLIRLETSSRSISNGQPCDNRLLPICWYCACLLRVLMTIIDKGHEKAHRTASTIGASHNYASQIVAGLAGQFTRFRSLRNPKPGAELMHAFQTVSQQTPRSRPCLRGHPFRPLGFQTSKDKKSPVS